MDSHTETAREILKNNGVEIDAGDHRSAEEIVEFLGLGAMTGHENVPEFVQQLAAHKRHARNSPYLAH